MRCILFLCLCLLGVLQSGNASDLACPDQFHVVQDCYTRSFRILKGGQSFGRITSSGFGRLDFYDSDGGLQWVNLMDDLYDIFGRSVGKVDVTTLLEWYFVGSGRIDIFSESQEHLATMQTEGESNHFIFRDAQTLQPLAIADWNWIPTGTGFLACLGLDCYVQEWSVVILDRKRLIERRIPDVFLVWALLKHSQKHLPSPDDLHFESTISPFITEP